MCSIGILKSLKFFHLMNLIVKTSSLLKLKVNSTGLLNVPKIKIHSYILDNEIHFLRNESQNTNTNKLKF